VPRSELPLRGGSSIQQSSSGGGWEGAMDADLVTLKQKVEGETLVKRREVEVVRRRQVVVMQGAQSCLHCCHCCRRRGRRLSYQELSSHYGEPLITRPRSLFVAPEPLYEELGPPSTLSHPSMQTMQTLDVRLRESRGELVQRGVRDFQDYPDSGLGSEQGSLGRLSTDSQVIIGDEVLAPAASKQGRSSSWVEAARSYLRRQLAKKPQSRRSLKLWTSVREREPGTSSIV